MKKSILFTIMALFFTLNISLGYSNVVNVGTDQILDDAWTCVPESTCGQAHYVCGDTFDEMMDQYATWVKILCFGG